MAIVVDYAADPTLQATAAALGSGAAVANEQDWRERALAEQQYQFDQEYDWRVQQAALQDRLARYEMGNRTALGFGQLQSNNYNNQLDYMLGQQTLAQRDEQLGVEAALQSEQQQQLTNRAQMSQLGQIARQQQQQKFESAMADRKAAEDWLRTASPRQAAQFRQRWEEKSGLSWNAPDEAMAAEEEQFYTAEREKLKGMLQAPDGSGELMVPEAIVDALMDLDKDKRIDAWSKIHDTWTRRKKDEQSAKTGEIEWEESKANMQRDDERASQSLQHQQQSHEQKLVMDAIKAVQQSRIARAQALGQAMTADSKAAIPKELKLEDLLPANLLPNSGPPEWYLKLKPGEEYTAPDGSRRIKGK
jgi:hypothetical protein